MKLVVAIGAFVLTTACYAFAASPAIVLKGEGVQIYSCTTAGGGYAWRLKAPDANLTDAAGNVVGHHFAGPSWQATDGSTVVGDPVVTSASPQPKAIPWLVLAAKSHSGPGLFSSVAYVVRSATVGGVAPAAGCDQLHVDTETRVDYSATYTFFPKAD
ncbi:DUF3455 domain-containing protein [Acidisphaera sp. L21]|jgi:hypothetical protein|uniref:DUF3455 domain-containing protein n=1 Tax=Acidisphaera sp. L21 TaxID=1641851 RepID=UPI00131D17F4|nr:DUF3455 domain-containing protein [Acidisphaera sp. L21]